PPARRRPEAKDRRRTPARSSAHQVPGHAVCRIGAQPEEGSGPTKDKVKKTHRRERRERREKTDFLVFSALSTFSAVKSRDSSLSKNQVVLESKVAYLSDPPTSEAPFMSHRLLIALAALLTTAVFEMASAAPFPLFDDGGVVNWKLSYAQAQSLAKKSGKPIFVAAGKDKDGDSEKLVQTTLRDERIGQFLNRHFVPVGVDFPYAEAQLRPILLRAGKTPPVIVILNDQGQYLVGLTGYKKPNEVEAELIKVLEDKANAVPKSKEADLTKQVEMLEKALGDKAWP